MKAIKKLLYELYKNFKLIFRNWSSLVLIILAPLLLILLVGYSMSGDSLHDIHIGVVAQDNIDLSEFQKNITGMAELEKYSNLASCLGDMALAKTHICIAIEGNLTPEGGDTLPNGKVDFYIDNTRMKISLPLLTQIKDFFGITSERISLVSTETIFDNLQNFLGFLNDRIDDMEEAKNEADSIRLDLIERRKQLVDVRDDFKPKYLLVKKFQKEVHTYADMTENATSEFFTAFDTIEAKNNEIRQALANLSATLDNASSQMKNLNLTQLNMTYSNMTLTPSDINLSLVFESMDLLNNAVDEAGNDVAGIKESANKTFELMNNATAALDGVVAELDRIDELLESEINRTDKYIEMINASVAKMDVVLADSRAKIKEVSRFDSSITEQLIRPLTQSFTKVRTGVEDIQLAFPVLLTTVIVFISLLFSNIITLLEIYNKAYTRNILAPVNDLVYTAGLALTNFIIIIFQIGVLLAVAQLSFGMAITSHLGSVLLVAILLTLTFIFIGMIIGYLSSNIQTSILISTFTALIFFLFSDMLNALEAMPKFAALIASYNPVVIANAMFRQIMFFNIPLQFMIKDLMILAAYCILTGGLLLLVSKIKNKKRF